MSEPTVIRIDFRLFHGMVAINWTRYFHIKHIYFIDEEAAGNDVMEQIFTMAKPEDVTMEFYSVDDAAAKWKEGYFDESGDHKMVLIKNIDSLKRLVDQGVHISKVIVGNTERGAGKKAIKREFFLDDNDARELNQIEQSGVDLEFQQLPADKPTPWKNIRDKYFKKL